MACANPVYNTDDCEIFQNLIKAFRIESSIEISLFSLITLTNFYYLFTRIVKLEKKSFHLMMFGLLQLSYTLLFVSDYYKIKTA